MLAGLIREGGDRDWDDALGALPGGSVRDRCRHRGGRRRQGGAVGEQLEDRVLADALHGFIERKAQEGVHILEFGPDSAWVHVRCFSKVAHHGLHGIPDFYFHGFHG